MIKRMIALLLAGLCLHGGALAGGIQLRMKAEDSEVLSDGAQRALSQWLEDACLVLYVQEDRQEAALYHKGLPLAAATGSGEAAVLTAEGLTAALEARRYSVSDAFAQALGRVQQLGGMLAGYEKSANASAELGGAVKAKTQLSYALTGAQWAEIWPQVCGVLGEELAGVTIESKGTLRRYFTSDGSEIGAYFYAEKVRIAENDVREVRLEYAFRPGEGLYLSFRCPNARETQNLRISLTARRMEREDRVTHTLDCDVRSRRGEAQDTLTADASLKETEGILSGRAEVNYTKKRGEDSVKYALAVKPDVAVSDREGTAAFEYTRAGLQVLKGTLTLRKAEEKDVALPAVNAEADAPVQALAAALMHSLEDIQRADQLELLYYLNRAIFLTGEEKEVQMIYDPEFTVTEVPE